MTPRTTPVGLAAFGHGSGFGHGIAGSLQQSGCGFCARASGGDAHGRSGTVRRPRCDAPSPKAMAYFFSLSPALLGWRLAQGVQVQARRCSVKFYRQPGLTLDRELAMVGTALVCQDRSNRGRGIPLEEGWSLPAERPRDSGMCGTCWRKSVLVGERFYPDSSSFNSVIGPYSDGGRTGLDIGITSDPFTGAVTMPDPPLNRILPGPNADWH